MKCSQCGKEHEREDMELSFWRPDDVASLSAEEKKQMLKENNDLCVMSGERFFIRGVLPIKVHEWIHPCNIGLWVEVERAAFDRVYLLWSEPDQEKEPPFEAVVANHVPSLPETIGLKAHLHLTGPKTRPNIFITDSQHPLYAQQASGVTAHQAYEYSSHF